jgi:hypothetical protein
MNNRCQYTKLRTACTLTAALAMIAVSGLLAQQQPSRSPAERGRQVTDLTDIPLGPGVNRIARFTPDGGDAIIVQGWRDNGNAHGYSLFVVIVNGTEIAGVDYGDHFEDTVRDEPHAGEDTIKSVRFARGKFNGTAATFLITASRDLSHASSLVDPAYVVIDLYELVDAESPGIGTTVKFFKRVSQIRSTTRYCNSDLALFKEFGLPLFGDYKGNMTDGCS